MRSHTYQLQHQAGHGAWHPVDRVPSFNAGSNREAVLTLKREHPEQFKGNQLHEKLRIARLGGGK